MSKDRKKLLHIHSSVNDKQPTPATLELGELGVNNAKGNAFISTKNSDGEIVRFSEDETIIGWMEQKEVFPYEGYMRGADNSQVSGVTEQDLLDNKSNLIIKLNQVVPQYTDYSPYDEKVNGAKDIYGNLINPISAGGYKDGAGLAIDMSKYAMIGANPSFSSITTTCHATLNGTTEVKGKGDGCGSKFTVEVANACIDATDTLNEYGVNHSNFGTSCDGTKVSNDTTLKGKKILVDAPNGEATVDIQACTHISGRTNDFVIRECADNQGNVEIDTTTVNVSASTTDIKSCEEIKLESKNIDLTDGDCGDGQITIDTNDLCLVGRTKINVYGDETNVGLDCDGTTIARNTRVFGNDIYVTANNNLCESGESSFFYGTKVTHIGMGCDGNKSTDDIIYERIADSESCGISSTTVDAALHEVYERSKVSLTSTAHTDTSSASSYTEYTLHQDVGGCERTTAFTINDTIVAMSAETYPTTSELLKKYTLWQYIGSERKEIGEINIPKDHILKDVSIVNGIYDENTGVFTECSAVTPSSACSYYIKLVWNVFDPSTGHADDKITYLPADDFVQDYEFHDSPAIDFTQWYDGQKNHVSADTTIIIMSNDGQTERKYGKANAVHTLSAYTLNSVSGDVKTADAATNWTYDPFDKKVTISAATDASHINRKTVSWSYGDVKSASGDSYDPGDGTVNTFGNTRTMSFVIPQCVNDLNRHKITFQSGSVSGFTSQTYDPGNDCANSAETINVPTSITHLLEWDGSCLNIPGCAKATNFYQTSDINAKENIEFAEYHKLELANKIFEKKFNFKDDITHRDTYGVIAQDVEEIGLNEIVITDEIGRKSVDYTSLMILKIAYLEHENKRLRNNIIDFEKRIKKLEEKN